MWGSRKRNGPKRNVNKEGFPGWLKLTNLWFLIIGVGNLLPVIPVLGLFGFRVLNFSGRQEVPVILQIARLNLLIVDLDFISVVRVDNQCVQVGVLIVLQGIRKVGKYFVLFSNDLHENFLLVWFNIL